jgi:hypothetical protein
MSLKWDFQRQKVKGNGKRTDNKSGCAGRGVHAPCGKPLNWYKSLRYRYHWQEQSQCWRIRR